MEWIKLPASARLRLQESASVHGFVSFCPAFTEDWVGRLHRISVSFSRLWRRLWDNGGNPVNPVHPVKEFRLLVSKRAGFTLVELLVSMAISVVLMLILVSITSATQRMWSYTTGKVEQFREAREAFESVTRRISQATLNTYWDYHYPTTSSTVPDSYIRQSELRFISGPGLAGSASSTPPRPGHSIFFQAPLGFVSNPASYPGLNNLLNTWGYYVEFANDSAFQPPFYALLNKPQRYRFRLMEMMEPSDSLTLYAFTSGTNANGAKCTTYNGTDWFTTPLGNTSPKRAIAENVIALVILPKLTPGDEAAGGYTDTSLAPAYTYDSTSTNADPNLNPHNQLPPVVQVTMVAVDEASYNRFQSGSSMPNLDSNLFSNASNYSADLQTLQTNLQNSKLNYHVFTTNVSIKGAKWSRAQTN